jgi:GH15 family glucan-1,4-alpha-glucosidase
MRSCKFIVPTDPRRLSTLDAVTAELVSDQPRLPQQRRGVARRARREGGTFSMCAFWWVDALGRAGRLGEARLAFEKMLSYATHVGLHSEEIGPTGEQLGNFPQAVTHLALICAVYNLDL